MIQVLPKEIAELIAAGEVIERPASVLKELIENAIDAGSTAITVEIQGGGAKYIRVTDNGCGIAPDEAAKAFLRHATSKVSSASDLDCIGTLGFRGEALASIAAVARVEMMTRTAEAESGVLCRISGAEKAKTESCGCPQGTTIVVRDLFYNVPARLKFLKKDITEGNAAAAIVDKIALSHPEISFRLIRDGKSLYRTPGDGVLLGTVYTVLGREFANSLVPVSYELGQIKAEGLVCRPMGSRARRTMQFFFINGRYTQSNTCAAALERGYDGMIMTGKFPACVLMLTMPPEMVDVNVHPAKIEVRFTDERPVFEAVYFAVKTALKKADALPGVQLVKPALQPASSAAQAGPVHSAEPPVKSGQTDSGQAAAGQPAIDQPAAGQTASGQTVSARRQVQIREEWLPRRRETVALDVEADPNDFADEAPAEDKTRPDGQQDCGQAESTPADEPAAERQAVLLPPAADLQVFGEIFSTYILCRMGGELVLIDKHAAHERILYNELEKNHEQLARQMLLASVTITLERAEKQAVMENQPLFERLGFEVEDFGGNAVILRAVPAVMADADAGPLFLEAVAGLMDKRGEKLSALEEILHRMACRSAVKGGGHSTIEELRSLAETVFRDENVRYCPHGRPVMLRWSRRELEKLFGRIQ